MEMPSHPSQDDTAQRHDPATSTRWVAPVVIGIIAVVFVVMVILHLSGAVGPGAH